MNVKYYDRVVIGCGIYGLYAAMMLTKKGFRTLVVDSDSRPMSRSSLVNQARLHNGYHYPRSLATAIKSSGYFDRFYSDFDKFINGEFDKIYAVAKNYSWTNAEQFKKVWSNLGIKCDEIDASKYFKSSQIEAAFLTKEYSFDASMLRDFLLQQCKASGCDFFLNTSVSQVTNSDGVFTILFSNGSKVCSPWVLNATYAGTNQIHNKFGFDHIGIKYELCEVNLCNVDEQLQNLGLTVMDGPFFSLMPFGKTGYHSLTTVSHTPHMTSSESLPVFSCQSNRPDCSQNLTMNCNSCQFAPVSAFDDMRQTARKYLLDSYSIKKVKSMFAIKSVLRSSEVDDSRPTLLRKYSSKPFFHTIFSGKINAIYDLDEIL